MATRKDTREQRAALRGYGLMGEALADEEYGKFLAAERKYSKAAIEFERAGLPREVDNANRWAARMNEREMARRRRASRTRAR